ncbi:unnamed protein product [Brassicogethes aeneus]|uniref:ADP-ribosylation factor-like protein 13B n=1 Tax=Brassicogethes aeneus TaxID=1431903 RepID=A0A9P0AT61_BRAAE|nr:unnamed protein product [Brassicogethes aeneus]
MGNTLCCYKRTTKKKIVLLLLGLDNAGKTVAAKGLAGQSNEGVVPTMGFSIINLKFLSYNVDIYDLGGAAGIRGIWNKYFTDAHGVIFVVDSSDISRLEEAKLALFNILSNEKIAGKPLLILANKQDFENALDEVDIIEELDIENIVNIQKCPTLVESCTATEVNSQYRIDPGIKRGYDWLLSYISGNFEKLNCRVLMDVKEQNEIDKRVMAEKIARIKAMQLREKEKNDVDAIESYSDYARKLDQQTQTNEVVMEDIASESEKSFPEVYPVREPKPERPKSARQLVIEQLQMTNPARKTFFKSNNKVGVINSRKTRSAKEKRSNSFIDTRNLKSAGHHRNFKSMGDTIEIPNVVSVGPNGDNNPKEVFRLNNLSLKNAVDDVPWFHKTINGDSGISVVDVD